MRLEKGPDNLHIVMVDRAKGLYKEKQTEV